ncbi:hypothetical protein LARI1_G004857 [Lachnellula arida]|uniref:SMP-30/Gluconolactonase/LRE-like region domain-containing protein n=1 Tax=Lachnellula arida TaxID=1316785 RepID=A0A8T9BBS5_9HELO|nr:hypothetical protein LARI1_G004857 [Lachnellula arida]
MLINFLLSLLFTLSHAIPLHTPNRAAPTITLTPTSVASFPKGTWLENLAIRQSDGNALVTILSAPEVYLISTNNEFAPIKVATFPNALGCLGIVELRHDIFYVVVGNWSASTGLSTLGSYSVWEIDMRDPERSPKTRKIADLPESGFLNGMTILDPVLGVLLVSDSYYEAVWSVDVYTGEVAVAVNDTTMATVPGASPALGINGVHLLDEDLYYSNTNKATFNKISVDVHTGKATGPAEILLQSTTGEIFPDDFTIDTHGNVWLASDLYGELDLLTGAAFGTGTMTLDIVAGSRNDKSNTGWTSAQFGTRKEDVKRGSLYVTTNGGPLNYIYQNWTAGGMLIRLDTVELGLY